jgi:hypothetical protein
MLTLKTICNHLFLKPSMEALFELVTLCSQPEQPATNSIFPDFLAPKIMVMAHGKRRSRIKHQKVMFSDV